MTLGEKIKRQRKILGLSADCVAEAIGVSRATLYRYESADDSKIPMGCLGALADILNTSVDFLMGVDEEKERWIAENTIPISQITYLPIIGVVRAGVGGITFEDNLGTEFVETSVLKGHTPSEFFWSKVKGDSMEPRLFEDDLVLVRKQTSVPSGSYAVVG